MAFRLIGPGGHWLLPLGESLLGRAKDCLLQINDPRLSRHHARLELGSDGCLRIGDLGSANGVLVNGDRIAAPTVLRHGDVIVCGPCVFRVEQDEAPLPPPPPRRGTVHGPEVKEPTLPMDPVPVLKPHRPELKSPSRKVAAVIAEAVSAQHPSTKTPPETEPGPEPRKTEALAPRQPRDPPAPDPADTRRTTDDLAPPPDLRGRSSTGAALERPASDRRAGIRLGLRRLGAGLLDLLQLGVTAGGIAAPLLLTGWVSALTRAHVSLQDGLPSLTAGTPAPLSALLGSLGRPGGLANACRQAEGLRHLSDQGPFLVLFLACVFAFLAILVVLLLGTVGATVMHGGPWWHQRLMLRIVVQRNGHHPGWLRCSLRFLLAFIFLPVLPLCCLAARRGPHDWLTGCEVRGRS